MRFKFLKKILRIIAIILPCFLFTFVFSSNSFAYSECSLTVYNNLSNWQELPSSCSLPLSSYHYIKVSGSNSSSYLSLRVGPSTSDIRFNLLNMATDFDIRAVSLEDNFKFYSYGVQSVPSGTTIILFDSLGSTPSGNFSITANGDYDISQYASVSVAVPPEVIQGDYHDDLVSISHSLILIPAVALVIYFFFAIYRLLIGGF